MVRLNFITCEVGWVGQPSGWPVARVVSHGDQVVSGLRISTGAQSLCKHCVEAKLGEADFGWQCGGQSCHFDSPEPRLLALQPHAAPAQMRTRFPVMGTATPAGRGGSLVSSLPT